MPAQNTAAETLRAELETLGTEDVHPPGELPSNPDEWYYTTHHDTHAIIDSTGNSLSRTKTHGEQTRIEYKHSTTTSSWHCGTLNITYAHEPATPDTVEHDDIEEENAVYGAYIYLSLNWIKPVEKRESKHDRRRHDREELLAVDSNTPVDIEHVLDTVKAAQQRLTERAEALDDSDRQRRIDRAERHWDAEKEEYVTPNDENQSMLASFA
jgi:hypothetical protein